MRKELKWFAGEMEKKLQLHDGDRGSEGWAGDPFEDLLQQITRRCNRIRAREGNDISNCIDIANFAMMIADNCHREE